MRVLYVCVFFRQKTAYEMRISDWSSDVCSSDLLLLWLIFGNIEQSGASAVAILWLLGFFVLRNGWFTLFEMGGRGATPGKRLMGLRVVARDGEIGRASCRERVCQYV